MSTKPSESVVQAFRCPCCGASVKKGSNDCSYCGSSLITMDKRIGRTCPECQSPVLSGQTICTSCGTILQVTDKLLHSAKKVQFSQNKYRETFIPEVRAVFSEDEYIHADTYGPREYYILTSRHLYVCRIEVRSELFSMKYQLGPVKRTVDLKDVTRIFTWSQLFYDDHDTEYKHPFMQMRLETSKGDVYIKVNTFEETSVFYKDLHFFGSQVTNVINRLEHDVLSFDEALYKLDLSHLVPRRSLDHRTDAPSGDLVFQLTDHTSSFDSRTTGNRLRNLIVDLSKQNPGRTVEIVMEDVDIMSSSFADELFGKLFVEMGPVDFCRSVKFKGINTACKRIVNLSIFQRVAQTMRSVTTTK